LWGVVNEKSTGITGSSKAHKVIRYNIVLIDCDAISAERTHLYFATVHAALMIGENEEIAITWHILVWY